MDKKYLIIAFSHLSFVGELDTVPLFSPSLEESAFFDTLDEARAKAKSLRDSYFANNPGDIRVAETNPAAPEGYGRRS